METGNLVVFDHIQCQFIKTKLWEIEVEVAKKEIKIFLCQIINMGKSYLTFVEMKRNVIS